MRISKTYRVCLEKARALGNTLFPDDCIKIMETVYGIKRMEAMVPKTIYDIVWDMQNEAAGGNLESCEKEILEVVETWMSL